VDHGRSRSAKRSCQTVNLRTIIETLKRDIGSDPDPDLIKQAFSDLNALERQNLRNHFEARQEYVRQVGELNCFAHRGVMEYGLQTLKMDISAQCGRDCDVPVPSFGPRMRCTKCGHLGATARPNWIEWADKLPGGMPR
jgi:hypothetical protein